MRKALFVLLISGFVLNVNAQQEKNKQNNFAAPFDIKLYLSGTFGELRSDHFHSGIDIKTQGVEGKNVYAIEDGYVSRLRVSPNGFGKALYIAHPNGYTSVYGHLLDFNENISEFVKKKQYERESFSVNLFPDKDEIPVERGQLIAFSGNTGGSLGPHLHFEIRETATQKPLNPLFFDFEIKDYVRPDIEYIKIYSVDAINDRDYSENARKIKVDGWGLNHRLHDEDTIVINGNVAFGIATHDKLNDMPNKNGVYSVSLFIDSVLFYEHNMDAFSFSETRYINSLIDYAEYVESGLRFQRTEIDPNNRLSIYEKVENRGVYIPVDTLVHQVKYIVKDAYGNTSELSFLIKYELEQLARVQIGSPPNPDMYFTWERENQYQTNDFKVETTAGAFYRDFVFTHSTEEGTEGTFGKIHRIHDDGTPVHKYIQIFIKADSLPPDLLSKALLVRQDDEGEFSSAGGEYEDGFVRASIRDFGNYAVMVDTVRPEIKPINIYDGKDMTAYKNIRLKIDDDLSGIADYRATINGKWVLMEYDPKFKLLTYKIDEHLPKGESNFVLEVRDHKDNVNRFKAIINRR